MKKIYTIFLTVLLTASLFAQSPQKMSYQAVIRNNSDQLVTNHAVGMQISILQGSSTGTPVYVETQTPTTNANGLVSIEIGGGAGFDAINWANDIYFIKTETDPTGGATYTISGTTQLLSVPYALHAKTVASYPETDPKVGVNTTNYLSKWDGAALVSSTIFDNGKIGIGTNNPVENLHLKTTTTHGNIKLETSDGDGYYLGFNGGDYMAISVINGGTPYWDVLNLKSGNVGVGTTNPSTKLDVNGIITSTGGNSTSWNTAFSKIAAVPTATLKGRVTAGTGLVEDLTAVQVRTLLNVDDGANNYTHPTGDGNLHVPATGTTNSGKVLTAGATAGSLSWEIPTGGGSSYYLGQSKDGGIIFNIYKGSDGQEHGLIVALSELTAKWQNTGTLVNANRSWDGIYNTNLMTDSPARTYVESLGVGWYLPSIDELSMLWHNRFYVNKAMNDGAYTLLSSTTEYWSSTENNDSSAWAFSFLSGYTGNGYNKGNSNFVRAIRAF